MKVKVLDTKLVSPGENVVLRFGVKSSAKHLVAVRIYAIPGPPEGSSHDVIEKFSDIVAKWLSSENMNI